jgi:hypothetical protein
MKLRFRKNSLRLRINQQEVETLAAGSGLREQVSFPGGATLAYLLDLAAGSAPSASLEDSTIHVSLPTREVRQWAASEEIGLYFEFPAGNDNLKVAIEKDLACIDGPEEERDPDAFPRASPAHC